MNPEAEKVLADLLRKSPHELNKEEIAFLRARRSYLTSSDIARYESVLNLQVIEGEPQKTEQINRIEGLDFQEMDYDQLIIAAQHFKIKGSHLENFYRKDVEGLRRLVIEVQENS